MPHTQVRNDCVGHEQRENADKAAERQPLIQDALQSLGAPAGTAFAPLTSRSRRSRPSASSSAAARRRYPSGNLTPPNLPRPVVRSVGRPDLSIC